MQHTPVSVLVDNSVLSRGVFVTPVTVQKRIHWGDSDLEITLEGYKRLPPRPKSEQWLEQQIGCLPTVGRMICEGHIDAYVYNEILAERAHRRPGAENAGAKADAFYKCDFKYAEAAVERSRFFATTDIKKHLSHEAVRDFCAWLLERRRDGSIRKMVEANPLGLPASEIERLKDVHTFAALCSGVSDKHYRDIFHLWTAEMNNLDYYLLIDRTFENAIRRNTFRAGLRCKPISPSDFLRTLGVRDLDPIPLNHDQFYNIFEVR